jgi:hypothetical protein
MILCLLAAVIPFLSQGASQRSADDGFPGWPSAFEGRQLKPHPMTDAEERFYRAFPGKAAKFTDGERSITMRWIARETRMLHPSSVCFKGSGYSVLPLPLFRDSDGTLWERFEADGTNERLIVRERIYDMQGVSWTDVSAWYWAAALSRSQGPWWAITVVERSMQKPNQ